MMRSAPYIQKPIKVLIVDDHPLVREGIIRILETHPDIEVVAEAENGLEAIEKAGAFQPDLVLMDIRMPGCNGIEATRRILEKSCRIKVVILTVSNDDRDLFHAIEAGAQGYLQKDIRPQELVDMIRGIFRGEAPISRMAAARIIREFSERASGNRSSLDDLSERELEILCLAAQGLSNQEIAKRSNIALHTVKNHIRNILNKLHLQNRIQAIVFAVQEGALDTTK